MWGLHLENGGESIGTMYGVGGLEGRKNEVLGLTETSLKGKLFLSRKLSKQIKYLDSTSKKIEKYHDKAFYATHQLSSHL